MTNYTLTFKLEDTSFSTDERLLPLLRFSLEYSIDFGNDEIYTFKTQIDFNPKSKLLVFQEYTLGKGFAYTDLVVEQAWNLHNPLKSTITNSVELNRAGNWLSYWHIEKATDSDKKKLEVFTSWWKNNFESIKEEIILHKDEYNQQIVALFSRSLID
jgi:hypothetical protein